MLADSNFSMNLGRMPVGFMRPTILPAAMPVCSKTNRSCMTITSPSMPCTSVMQVILREPSFMRSCCTIRSMAEDTCSRMAFTGNSMPAISTIVSRRERQSLGELAWAVVSGPRLQRDNVLLAELELGRVLDRDDALVGGDEAGEHVEGRGLAGAGAARYHDVQAGF